MSTPAFKQLRLSNDAGSALGMTFGCDASDHPVITASIAAKDLRFG